MLEGQGVRQQAPTLARLLAEALAAEAALRLDAVQSGIVAGVRGVVLPPDLAPAELDGLEALLWSWVKELAGNGIAHPIVDLLEHLHLSLLRLRGRHQQRAVELGRLVTGGEGVTA